MIPYFDNHCDTARLLNGGNSLKDLDAHINLNKLHGFGPCAVVFAFFADKKKYSENEYGFLFDRMYTRFLLDIQKNSESIIKCSDHNDYTAAKTGGKIAALLSIEGAELIGCSVDKLEHAYNLGVRSVMPTWNYANSLSGSCAEDAERGLSDEGRRFARRALELGMILDVSHISDAGFYDIYELSADYGAPVIASHSNSRTVCEHRRNLTDRMFKCIVESHGIAGINMYTYFINGSDKCATGDILRHIEHFCALGGQRNIALGCDLDGCGRLPDGISGVCDMHKIYNALLAKNYPEELVNDIFYNNSDRVIKFALNR